MTLQMITGPDLGPHEPGTGPDWASAIGPGQPLPPRTTVVRAWDDIPSRGVPTDREHLLHLLASTPEVGTAEWANGINEITRIRTRAAAGYHDGSLPELGHFRPVYFDGINTPTEGKDHV